MRHHAAMDEGALTELVAFRAALYGCFGRRRDALFEVVEALLGAGMLGAGGSGSGGKGAADHPGDFELPKELRDLL